MFLKLHWAQKQMFWAFENGIFQFKASFWVTKLVSFSGKVRQNIKIYLNQNLVKKSFLETRFKSWGEERMFWTFEKRIFQFFAKFWVTKVKLFSEKGRQSEAVYLNQKFVIRTFLGNGFGATLRWKTNVVSVWKEHFSVFAAFWVMKSRPFSGRVRQSIQNCLNPYLVIESFLENGLEVTLSSRTNVLSVWKGHFSDFCKVLSGKVETIFRKSKAKRSKLFKLKFGHKNFLRKWFWSKLELKNECCERLKRAFFSFLHVFEWRSWEHFLGKSGKVLKSI